MIPNTNTNRSSNNTTHRPAATVSDTQQQHRMSTNTVSASNQRGGDNRSTITSTTSTTARLASINSNLQSKPTANDNNNSNIYTPRSGLTRSQQQSGGRSDDHIGIVRTGVAASSAGAGASSSKPTNSNYFESKSDAASRPRRFTSILSSGPGLGSGYQPAANSFQHSQSLSPSAAIANDNSSSSSIRPRTTIGSFQNSSSQQNASSMRRSGGAVGGQGGVGSPDSVGSGSNSSPGSDNTSSRRGRFTVQSSSAIDSSRHPKGPIGQRYERARSSLQALHDRLANKQPF